MPRYRCLVLDHDDTTVDSTRSINYPQFLEALAHFRPGVHMSLDEYMMYCFSPGFYDMCEQVLHYSEKEMREHIEMWKTYHKTHHPAFFPGIPELLQRQKAEGGYICVVSHSSIDVIQAAYEHAHIPLPDLIFGAEQPAERRKPNPWPMTEIMRLLNFQPHEVLMVDDMPHGGIMSHAVGIEFACAGWCGMLPTIEKHMRENSDYFFTSVEELYAFQFNT